MNGLNDWIPCSIMFVISLSCIMLEFVMAYMPKDDIFDTSYLDCGHLKFIHSMHCWVSCTRYFPSSHPHHDACLSMGMICEWLKWRDLM